MSFTPITYRGTDVASHVKAQFGDEAGAQITNAEIIRWINQAQDEICNVNRVIKAKGTTDIIAGQKDYDVSGLNVRQIESISIDGTFLKGLDFPTAKETILADPDSGHTSKPLYWYEWGGVVSLHPTPDKTAPDGITLYFTKNPTRVSNLSDYLGVPDKYYNNLLDLVLAKAYELDENWDASQMKQGSARRSLEEIGQEDLTTQHSTYSTITVLD